MTQRLDHLEDDRVPERSVRGIEFTLDHDPFSQLPRCHLAGNLEMTYADVGDLALLEEAMADHVAGALFIGLGEQPDRRVDMRQIVFGLRNLRLIGRDTAMDLGALALQSLND